MNKKYLPDISIIVCAYNHSKWIERCIRSLNHQDNIKDHEYEIIIINDCSKDDTRKILKKFKYLSNLRVINNSKNIGLPESINKGIKISNGRYIVRVDSDDYVARNFLYLLKLYLDYNRNHSAVACDYLKVDEKENTLSRFENKGKNQIACGILFRKESLYDIGLYNKKFKMREGHYLRKVYEKKFNIINLNFPLYKYRMHSKNRTKKSSQIKKYDKLFKKIK